LEGNAAYFRGGARRDQNRGQLLGRQFRVTKSRGEWITTDFASHLMATLHPSALLNARS
jgi:uracil-DNA glycosylase